MRTFLLLSLLVGTPAFAGTGAANPSADHAEGGKVKGIVKAIDADKGTLTLSVQKNDRTFTFKGIDVAGITSGAHVLVTYDAGKATVATSVKVIPDK